MNNCLNSDVLGEEGFASESEEKVRMIPSALKQTRYLPFGANKPKTALVS